ncbi:MAG TPA: adenylate/guanylate cyclase domain-containing protein [Candidatus Acidoferrales bacterium]|nr:adenylate/guanylate cyclase domain-containing protein [Candidatus Acidoferrales bacterium]
MTAPEPRPAEPGRPERSFAMVSRNIPEELAQKIRASKDSVEGERKQVTVMFCDLAGSTAMAERLDPEEYHDLLEQYLELAFRAVYRYEGIVNQLAGDGFMALFGAPVAHEDAPQRAVRTALDIQRDLSELNERLFAERGLELRARVGINTGPVVVGGVGNDLKMDYSAIGDTTNLAARLEALATPGTTLVSEATYRLIRGRFEVRPAGPFAVKGKSEPVTAFEIVGLAGDVGWDASPLALAGDRGLTPFVGRHAELAQLEACYQRLRDGLPQFVIVVGEAGSGKSRLLYELRERMAGQSGVWFEARCSAWNQMVPYHPFVSMLRRFFGVTSDDPPESVRDKVAQRVRPFDPRLDHLYPWLCGILGVMPEILGNVSEDEIKLATFEAISRLVANEAMRAPVVMLIEDLHWMDEPSRQMLEAAASHLGKGQLMMLLSHRPDFRPTWRTQAAFTQLHLRPLSDDHVSEIIRSLAGGPLPADLELRIRTKAEGSPFLAEEITRSLVEKGDLSPDDGGRKTTKPVDEIRIPGTVQEVIAARLDRLGAGAKRVVQVAAVLGRQFSRTYVKELLAGEGIDADQELEELERRGVVHRRNLFSNDEYRFGESLTQEVAYEGLLLKQRRQLHERIGQLLEAAGGGSDPERAALLAHHFGRSENRSKTAQALLRSAADAERVPSYPTAARLYRQAWEVAHGGAPTLTDPALQRLALDAAIGIGRMTVIYGVVDPGDNSQLFVRAKDLAVSLNDNAALAGLHTYTGMLLMQRSRATFNEGIASCEDGLSIARRSGESASAVFISRGLAYGYQLDGRFEEARKMIDWLIEELERTGHRDRLSDIYLGSRWMHDRMYLLRDDFETAEASCQETYALAMRAGNRTVRASASSVLGYIALVRADYASAKRWSDESMEIILALGNYFNAGNAASSALLASLMLDPSVSVARYVDLIMQSAGPSNDVGLNSHIMCSALLAAGELTHAERRAELAYERAGGRLRELHACLALGNVRAESTSGWNEAERLYDRAGQLAEQLGSRSAVALTLQGRGELSMARGDLDAGVGLLRQATVRFRDLLMPHYALRAESALAAVGGTVDERPTERLHS